MSTVGDGLAQGGWGRTRRRCTCAQETLLVLHRAHSLCTLARRAAKAPRRRRPRRTLPADAVRLHNAISTTYPKSNSVCFVGLWFSTKRNHLSPLSPERRVTNTCDPKVW